MKYLLPSFLALVILSCSSEREKAAPIPNLENSSVQHFDTKSSLSIPIEVSLAALEKRANESVPQALADINQPNTVCVKAEWLKTKIPTFRGLKIYSKTVKTKISPEIKCDIKGWVKRDGQIRLTGEGGRLQLAIPIRAQVSAKAIVRETAKARATLYVDVVPKVTKNWDLDVNVSPSFRWSQRPELKLFGFIKITIGSKVEPKLRSKLNEFAKQVPSLLAELEFKEKIATAWEEMQDPVQLNKSPNTSLIYRPERVGFSGFNIDNNILKAAFSTAGATKLYVGKRPKLPPKTELSQLQPTKFSEGSFNIDLPIYLEYEEIVATVNREFPDGQTVTITDTSSLTIRKPNISIDGENLKISLNLEIDNRSTILKKIDFFDWFTSEGQFTFLGTPKIDPKSTTLSVVGLDYSSTSNNELLDTLVSISALEPVRQYAESLVTYNFGNDVQILVEKANSAMNFELNEGVKVSGKIDRMLISEVTAFRQHLMVRVAASGEVNVSLGM